MKKNFKITLSAMMAALAVAVMLLSFFPYLTYAIPAIAGLFIMVVVIEVDLKWAIGSYLASAAIVLFLPEPESKLMYIFFFGYYPILKAFLDRMRRPKLEWIFKIIAFNTAVVIVYFAFSAVIDLSLDDFGKLGKYGVWVLLFLGNIVFVLYDIAVSRMSMMYMSVLHPRIKRMFKK